MTIYSLDVVLSYLEAVCCSMSSSASWPAHRFLKRQVRWSGIPISFRIFQFDVVHTVCIVNKAEVHVFLKVSCFFDDPVDVGNLISGSSAFLNPAWTSGSSWLMYSWSLAWRILSITLLMCEMSAILQYFEHSLTLPFFGTGMKTDLFQPCGHCWVFQICRHTECSTFSFFLEEIERWL